MEDNYSKVRSPRICRNGKAEHTFSLPLNAGSGKWVITVREAISGLSSSVQIAVE